MRRIVKDATCLLIVILSLVKASYAVTLSSDNYTLSMARIVAGGGSAGSSIYLLKDVSIGDFLGGVSESPNYTLNAKCIDSSDLAIAPGPPVPDPVTSPTNIPLLPLSGTKEPDTSVYINGYQAVALDSDTVWSCDKALVEGDNHFIVTARNRFGLESEPAYLTVTLDTVPPFIIVTTPLDGSLAYGPQMQVEGTIDGEPFTQIKDLIEGLNSITVEASDGAGNESSEYIEVYLIREPLSLPQS